MASTQLLAGSRITAAWLNSNNPGPWIAMPLASGVTNAGGVDVTAQYRMYNQVAVEIVGRITASSFGTAAVATLPAGYRPITNQPFTASDGGGGTLGLAFMGVLTTGGAIQFYDIPTGCTNIGFHAILSLDA